MDEKESIERLRRGDIGGLEMLVREHQVRAVRTAYLVTHDLPLAEEVVQAAFVRLYERVRSLDHRRPFAPWFFTCVLNDAVKAARARDRHLPLDGSAASERTNLPDKRPGPEVLFERAETAQEVWAALRKLAPGQRAAIVARYYLGLSEIDTASALGLPLTTTKWRLHTARQRLRLLLRALAPD